GSSTTSAACSERLQNTRTTILAPRCDTMAVRQRTSASARTKCPSRSILEPTNRNLVRTDRHAGEQAVVHGDIHDRRVVVDRLGNQVIDALDRLRGKPVDGNERRNW